MSVTQVNKFAAYTIREDIFFSNKGKRKDEY